MKGHFGTAFSLTWLPTLLIILLFAILGISFAFIAYYLAKNDATNSVVSSFNSGANELNQRNSGGSFSSFGGGLLGTILNTGIAFASLEWLRLKKGEVLEHPFKKAFQGFTFDYLLGIIVIYILTSIASVVGLLLLVIPAILFSYAFRIIYLLYYDVGDHYGYLELFRLSWKLMRGHKFDLFIFQLSFFWWYLGVVLTGGLLALYVVPYYNLAFAAFYDNIYQNSELVADQKTTNTDDFDSSDY